MPTTYKYVDCGRTEHTVPLVTSLHLLAYRTATGYYWIDPNVGNPSDAVQVYCRKPGCSCLDCDAPPNSASKQEWTGATNKYFTELGYEV